MNYFNVFSNIMITKGITRVLISDLQRNVSELYPLELHDLIEELKACSIEDVLSNYDEESKTIVQDYLDFLLEKEFGFITQDDWDKNFPPLSYEYQDYNILSNIFIELDTIDVLQTLQQSIENLEIKHMVIYCQRALLLEEFMEIDRMFARSPLEGIEIFSQFHETIDNDFIHALDKNTARIYNLVFYSCEKAPFRAKNSLRFTVTFTGESLKISSCGKVNLDYFSTNLPKVLEAVNHNSCLHKKIGIDVHGNIKNCPAMLQSYGNVKNTTLEQALNHKDFKKYWNVTKDDIKVCKDCEFRYICTDCRAYTERTDTDHDGRDISKPLKCGYDPYTGIWEDWSTHPLKKKAMDHYALSDKTKAS
ncbi:MULTISPECIES: grasp-with-spasm system SPASM domain peptide maturase [Chryseobacterium]|uniref:SPASM domain peptide maturase of grasp-with-spasm system n=1 Tax=Chryseobacterium camelliae TaxID=1265445 RepID=A0ABU0THD4_9FLAO|nr:MULTISPECIES: grasp-with-spasm system SPASM domain peptide maturase [Chryseobacterium]MDT3405730.1 SPASM domain peptide maturase of grasp-with-spasm system [Pseudacidovorax intermedius]MDQ1096462.1 SPASM domain peptide maturase of grasp-with-spasm system [Chryseobacterium camelliae]MDQ1100402.1 SPASM domain peptide maturase of grasp-with-spasm system [Chryseobacterium sp. SORGH_AS_1048]MDR6087743.1 SPASM domain peptide maturase of grasp-with-spasm system [Chryseobacterium sp. SORGH_AS_0909]